MKGILNPAYQLSKVLKHDVNFFHSQCSDLNIVGILLLWSYNIIVIVFDVFVPTV